MTTTAPTRTAFDREQYLARSARDREEREDARMLAGARMWIQFANRLHLKHVAAWLNDAHLGHRNDQFGYTVTARSLGTATLTFDDGREPKVIYAPAPIA